MALSQKERENIIEEETLRFETRRSLHQKACAERPRRWPWIVLGAFLVYGLWAYIFCGGGVCSMHGGMMCKGHEMGMMNGHKCAAQPWAPEADKGVEPGQPVKPEKK